LLEKYWSLLCKGMKKMKKSTLLLRKSIKRPRLE
jgi:hypothetical protein